MVEFIEVLVGLAVLLVLPIPLADVVLVVALAILLVSPELLDDVVLVMTESDSLDGLLPVSLVPALVLLESVSSSRGWYWPRGRREAGTGAGNTAEDRHGCGGDRAFVGDTGRSRAGGERKQCATGRICCSCGSTPGYVCGNRDERRPYQVTLWKLSQYHTTWFPASSFVLGYRIMSALTTCTIVQMKTSRAKQDCIVGEDSEL
ncbi:hypothetical protein BD413DRAFT_73829 [Trametes elegans]|nr:hypothetical protein BD413DRAFT_73829 [Trametes elegans]